MVVKTEHCSNRIKQNRIKRKTHSKVNNKSQLACKIAKNKAKDKSNLISEVKANYRT